jgi:hypothetical protein
MGNKRKEKGGKKRRGRVEEGKWKREIRIERQARKRGAITETGNRRMLAGRNLYKDRVENGANPGRGFDDIYIRVYAVP